MSRFSKAADLALAATRCRRGRKGQWGRLWGEILGLGRVWFKVALQTHTKVQHDHSGIFFCKIPCLGCDLTFWGEKVTSFGLCESQRLEIH